MHNQRIKLLFALLTALFSSGPSLYADRDSIVIIHYYSYEFVKRQKPAEVLKPKDTVFLKDTTTVPLKDTVTKRVILAPKTNLLLPLLNAGLEIPLGRRFSIAGDFYYPWLGYDKANSRCLQAILADLKVSWWFGQKELEGIRGNTLTGHSLSAGAICGKYDFEKDYRGFQGEIYGAYLDYGYTFCLGRHCRLGLCIGAGAAHIPYRTYTVYTEGGKLIKDYEHDETKNWFGPVHAGVTLSFPITGGAQ